MKGVGKCWEEQINTRGNANVNVSVSEIAWAAHIPLPPGKNRRSMHAKETRIPHQLPFPSAWPTTITGTNTVNRRQTSIATRRNRPQVWWAFHVTVYIYQHRSKEQLIYSNAGLRSNKAAVGWCENNSPKILFHHGLSRNTSLGSRAHCHTRRIAASEAWGTSHRAKILMGSMNAVRDLNNIDSQGLVLCGHLLERKTLRDTRPYLTISWIPWNDVI